jgi:antitoxin component of MazEF toxin-antitoxin module
MARELEVICVGDSLGIILPEDVLQHLGVEIGDTLSITEVSGASICPAVRSKIRSS